MTSNKNLQQIIDQVEKLSGYPVVIKQDPSLQTLATVKTGNSSQPFHAVSYRNSGSETDYIVAYQLGYLLRQFSLSEELRWQLASTPEDKKVAIKVLELDSYDEQMQSYLIDSLLIQLRSCVIGLRVDDWILENYPSLHSAQKSSVLGQLQNNLQCLSPEIKQQFPEKLIFANSAMNSVYAKFWGNQFDDPRCGLPYISVGLGDVTQKLDSIMMDTGETSNFDRDLVESWGEILNLSNTFQIQNMIK